MSGRGASTRKRSGGSGFESQLMIKGLVESVGSLTQSFVQLAARDSRGGFLPLLVVVADEDLAPGMGLSTGEVLRDSFGGRRLEETHAGLGCGPRLDRAVLLTS